MAIQGAMQVQIPASAVGANGYTFTINWPLAGVDLTTADTLSGNIRLTETGDPFPISGVLTATGANELTWKLHSSDTLTQGTAEVQFRATFGTDNIISAPSKWLIYNTLSGALPPPDPSAVSFIRNNGDGTYSFLNAADFRTAIGAGTGDGDMPLIDPVLAVGNLPTIDAGGSLVDAGYAADVNATAGSVVRRSTTGTVRLENLSFLANTIEATAADGFVAFFKNESTTLPTVLITNLGTGPLARFSQSEINNNGLLTFLGPDAVANRAAQRTELGLGTAAVEESTAFDAAGSAAGVQGNLDTHTGLTTAAHGGIVADSDARLTDARTPTAHAASHTSGGSDPLTPADIGAEVAGTTATHAALEGTAVHGLGTAALLNSTAVGEDLVEAVDVDGALETLDLPPQFSRPRHFDWQSGDWQSVDVVGSGGGNVAVGVYHNLFTGTTANSRIRRNINTTVMMLNRTNNAVNWSRRLDVSLQIRSAVTNAEGVFRIIICKPPAGVFGLPTVGDYVAMTVENGTITTGHVCKAGVLTNVALTPTNVNLNNAIHITSNNGTVSWYFGGTLLGTTTAGPTALGAGTINLEIENGATAAQYAMRLVGESWGY